MCSVTVSLLCFNFDIILMLQQICQQMHFFVSRDCQKQVVILLLNRVTPGWNIDAVKYFVMATSHTHDI